MNQNNSNYRSQKLQARCIGDFSTKEFVYVQIKLAPGKVFGKYIPCEKAESYLFHFDKEWTID